MGALVGPELVLGGVGWLSMVGLRRPSVGFRSKGREVSALKASRSALIWTCISGGEEGRQLGIADVVAGEVGVQLRKFPRLQNGCSECCT